MDPFASLSRRREEQAPRQAGRDRDDEIAGIPGVWAKYSTPSLINHLPKNHLTCSGSKPTARPLSPLLWQIVWSFVGLSRLTLFTPLLAAAAVADTSPTG